MVEAPLLNSFQPLIGSGGIEGILRRKDELKLTDQQAARLETIRREGVARRQAEARALIDLSSRQAAGLIERSEYRDEMDKIDAERRTAERTVRSRLEQILTEDQRAQMPSFNFESGRMRYQTPRTMGFQFPGPLTIPRGNFAPREGLRSRLPLEGLRHRLPLEGSRYRLPMNRLREPELLLRNRLQDSLRLRLRLRRDGVL
jgi:Spy/CpxP family protein refolding chaperone